MLYYNCMVYHLNSVHFVGGEGRVCVCVGGGSMDSFLSLSVLRGVLKTALGFLLKFVTSVTVSDLCHLCLFSVILIFYSYQVSPTFL